MKVHVCDVYSDSSLHSRSAYLLLLGTSQNLFNCSCFVKESTPSKEVRGIPALWSVIMFRFSGRGGKREEGKKNRV